MKVIKLISRIFVGLVFIFSGFVKAIDPLGTNYKFVDYFTAFGMTWLAPTAFTLAILMNTAEFVIGLSFFFNVKIKLTSWFAMIFMVFFTILTFILAIDNPVHDCGCFGDALILTNWQTFYKNLIIIVPTIIVFYNRKKFDTVLSKMGEWMLTGVFVILVVGLSMYCYMHLPLMNFRPYKIGVHIPDKMIYPDGAPKDEYKSVLTYKKGNITKEYTLEETSNLDSTWEWVSTDNKLIKKGYVPPIHDFSIQNKEAVDITDSILNYDSFTFLLAVYDVNIASTSDSKRINELADYCTKNNYKFLCLTSSGDTDIKNWVAKVNAKYEFCTTDAITLKTMIRANPGLVLLKHGTILGKWNHRDIPTVDELKKEYFNK